MATTTKYGLVTVEYGVTGWNGILKTSTQQIDYFLHTYARFRVASGESIAPYRPVCLQNGQWKLAMDDGSGRLPNVGLSIESTTKGSGEYLRAQRCGPVTNNSGEAAWSWDPVSGEVWTNESGELVQGVSGESWRNRQARVGCVSDETTIFIQL